MPTMGSTFHDVVDAYRARIRDLPLRGAFATLDRGRQTIVFTALLDQINHELELALADVDGSMLDSFADVALDFRTIHLFGRDVAKFIPRDAIPVIQPLDRAL